MALDEPKEADDVYEIDGFQYLVNKDFMDKAKPIKVDFHEVGFKLTSNLRLNSGCGSSCASDSCGH